jgi:hypothetical protein
LFVGADGLVAVDLTQASPTCQTVGALGGDRTGALHTDTTRRLLVPLGRDFVTIDADPTSPTYGREIDTRWRSPASFATPSVSWSPARRGELSGELPGSRFWTNDSNGLFELRANSDDLPRPMAFAGSAIFAPYWPTLNRRWLVGYASPGGNYMVAISDLASGRARSFAPATGLIRYGAGGPQDWVVVAGPYGGNPELRAYRIETAPVE